MKKSFEKERDLEDFRNRVSRMSVSRSSSLMPPSSRQLRPSRSPQPSQPSTSTNQRPQKNIEEIIGSIDRKIDDLLIRQQRLEKQISDMKESLYNQNANFNAKDKKFIDVIEVFENIFECFVYMYMY